jgi:peptide/nickel transport system substrate-binding protein
VATDPVTLDPHALNAAPTALITRALYEPLVGRGRDMDIVPALALSWQQRDAVHWRFSLRTDARFHDGAPLTARDVVFSITRAATAMLSDYKVYTSGIIQVTAIDPSTVEIVTAAPDAVLPAKLTRVFVMSEAWSRAHGVADPLKPGSGAATADANGTGPYRLGSFVPGGAVELARNPGWWGWHGEPPAGSPDRVVYEVIPDGAARTAALLAGDADLVLSLPPQSLAAVAARRDLRVLKVPENRTIMVGFDHQGEQLRSSDIKGRNPFGDRRVREAVYRVVDSEAIRTKLMDGISLPTASIIAPSVFGFSASGDTRPAIDVNEARRLMTEAGYADGFAVTFDCPSNRYENDTQICAAVAGMVAKIGIRATPRVLPFPVYVAKMKAHDSDFFLLGWGTPTFDSLSTLQALLHSPSPTGGADGVYNIGNYRSPAVDAAIDSLKRASGEADRLSLMREVQRLAAADVAYVPIHTQMVVWGLKSGIDAAIRSDYQLDLSFVRLSATKPLRP